MQYVAHNFPPVARRNGIRREPLEFFALLFIHTYIKDGWKDLRTKPRDHNGGAIRPGDLGKPRDLRLRSEFCTPAFPCPVQDVCGLRDGKTRIPTGASNRIPSSSGV